MSQKKEISANSYQESKRVYMIFSLVTQRQRADEKNREKILKEEKRKQREQSESLKQQRRAEV